ncbi:MAG: STAS domain-containing protein [Phycisphaerales bacterium]|nr:STAS domain-containing protein [Phycisphaerales bacterium]
MPAPTSSYLAVETDRGVAVATILCEKLSERESQIIQAEASAASRAAGFRLVLDCTALTFLPSVGLGMLVRLMQECRAGSGKLAVFGLADPLVEVLKITHLHKVIPMHTTREAAIRAVTG